MISEKTNVHKLFKNWFKIFVSAVGVSPPSLHQQDTSHLHFIYCNINTLHQHQHQHHQHQQHQHQHQRHQHLTPSTPIPTAQPPSHNKIVGLLVSLIRISFVFLSCINVVTLNPVLSMNLSLMWLPSTWRCFTNNRKNKPSPVLSMGSGIFHIRKVQSA